MKGEAALAGGAGGGLGAQIAAVGVGSRGMFGGDISTGAFGGSGNPIQKAIEKASGEEVKAIKHLEEVFKQRDNMILVAGGK